MSEMYYSNRNVKFTDEQVHDIRELTCRGVNYYMIIKKSKAECIGITTDLDTANDRVNKLNTEENCKDYIFDFIKNA